MEPAEGKVFGERLLIVGMFLSSLFPTNQTQYRPQQQAPATDLEAAPGCRPLDTTRRPNYRCKLGRKGREHNGKRLRCLRPLPPPAASSRKGRGPGDRLRQDALCSARRQQPRPGCTRRPLFGATGSWAIHQHRCSHPPTVSISLPLERNHSNPSHPPSGIFRFLSATTMKGSHRKRAAASVRRKHQRKLLRSAAKVAIWPPGSRLTIDYLN